MAKLENERAGAARVVSEEEHVMSAADMRRANAPQTSGFLLNAANWLLSRLPWFKYHYQDWSKTKRIVVGLLMYLICLPIIPIVIGVLLYIRDPEGFKKGNAIKVLGAVTAVWLAAFGLIGMQPSMPDNPLNSSAKLDRFNTEQKAAPEAKLDDNSDTAAKASYSEARRNVQDKTESADSKGRFFKNCDAAFAVGVFDIPRSDESYQTRLDRDSDGVACEK